MAHEVHTTEAIILSGTGVQDADKLFWLLTKDFGLIFASAKSVREEVSKLRYSLQDLSFTKVSLVRGRGLWRITGAQECEVNKLKEGNAKIFGRITTLVRRLMPTDEEHKNIFLILNNGRKELLEKTNLEEIIEGIVIARILYHLGYLSCKNEYRGVIDTVNFNTKIYEKGGEIIKKLVYDINMGLNESQL